jgi:hypothetical protein
MATWNDTIMQNATRFYNMPIIPYVCVRVGDALDRPEQRMTRCTALTVDRRALALLTLLARRSSTLSTGASRAPLHSKELE